MSIERISKFTYRIEHSPNCPYPFLVRMPNGTIDGKSIYCSRDFIGYGKNLDEAVDNVLNLKDLHLIPSELSFLNAGDTVMLYLKNKFKPYEIQSIKKEENGFIIKFVGIRTAKRFENDVSV